MHRYVIFSSVRNHKLLLTDLQPVEAHPALDFLFRHYFRHLFLQPLVSKPQITHQLHPHLQLNLQLRIFQRSLIILLFKSRLVLLQIDQFGSHLVHLQLQIFVVLFLPTNLPLQFRNFLLLFLLKKLGSLSFDQQFLFLLLHKPPVGEPGHELRVFDVCFEYFLFLLQFLYQFAISELQNLKLLLGGFESSQLIGVGHDQQLASLVLVNPL